MKYVKRFISCFMIVTLLFGVMSMNGSLLTVAKTQASGRLEMERNIGLALNDTYVLHLNTKKKVKWSSSDKKIVTVTQKGKITAKSYGEAIIIAKVSKKEYKCKVTVYEPCFVNKKQVYIKPQKVMQEGDTFQTRVIWFTPKSYSSNRPSIASVSKKGVIKAKKSGVATITVKDKLKRELCMKVVVQKKGTKKIAPTAIQKKRMKNPEYVSYNTLVKNNHYDTSIITDALVKNTKLSSIDNKHLPYFNGIIMENRACINNGRIYFDMSDAYSGGMTADYVVEDEIEFQAVNGMNCIRLMYSLSYLSKGADVEQVNMTELQVLDEIVSWCMKYNVSLMLSYSEIPGHDVDNAENIGVNANWMSDDKTVESMKRYIALIAQRYKDLPNSVIMYELEAEPAMTVLEDGTPDVAAYCKVNNMFADAIWEYKKDAVCIVEDIWVDFFPEECAKHGINIASHSDGRPETVGEYGVVGINTAEGEVYDPVVPVYLPGIISEETGKMTFVAEDGFEKQDIYVGAQDGIKENLHQKSLVEIYADEKKLDIQESTDTYVKAVIPKGAQKITIAPGVFDNVRVDAVRFGNLVIPAINHYQNNRQDLKQPIITIYKDGTYKDNMYDDLADWYYDVWLKEPYELCQKYGVSFIRTEVSTFIDSSSNFSDYEKNYDLGLNPKNRQTEMAILKSKLVACKKHGIGWNAICTNNVLGPATQIDAGSIAVNYKRPRVSDSGMVQWKKTGLWYISETLKVLKNISK